MGIGVALIGGFAEPQRSLRVVLPHTLAVDIQKGKNALGSCMALVGGFAKPQRSLRIVLPHTLAVDIHSPQIVLSGTVAFFS